MASSIKPKRSTTPGAVPTAAQLTGSEIAINIADQKLFVKNPITNAILLIGSAFGHGGTGEITQAQVNGLTSVLASKVNTTTLNDMLGAAGGVATLDANGRVPESQMTLVQDEIIEVQNYGDLPPVGNETKIYGVISTLRTYRWGGTQYWEIPGGGLVANRALISTAQGGVQSSQITDVELGRLAGVTANIQPQIDALKPGLFWITQYLQVQDERASGTAGGSNNNTSWQTRALNTVKNNGITGATLAGDEITLPAGTYHIEATVPGYDVNLFRTRLHNITTNSELVAGTGEDASGGRQLRSTILGRFVLPFTQTVAIQQRSQRANAGDGFGRPTSFGTEVYTQVKIWKIA